MVTKDELSAQNLKLERKILRLEGGKKPKGKGKGKGGKRKPSGTRLTKRIERFSEDSSQLLMSAGVINPFITVGFGRNFLHPAGGLADGTLVQPALGAGPLPTTGRVMIDTVRTVADQAYRDAIFGAGAKPGQSLGKALRHNLRSAFQGKGGIATTFGPTAVGIGARVANATVVPILVNLIKGSEKTFMRFARTTRS